MDAFNFGSLLLKLIGAKVWDDKIWWKKYLGYFYIFHVPFAFIYLICTHMAVIVVYWEDTRRMFNVLWRCCGLITLFAQGSIVAAQGSKFKKIFSLPPEVEIINLNPKSLKKRYNLLWKCYVGAITIFMTAYTIRKFVFKDAVAYNGNNDVEFFIPNMISNPVLQYFIHIHLSFVILQNFVVLVAHDFLYIYSLALIEEYIEHLKESINVMELRQMNIPSNRSLRRSARQSRYNIRYCVNLHNHIIQMTHIINSVFSISQLLLVWRSFVMSIAAYELTKRIEHLVSFIEVYMFLTNTVIQLFTMCLVSQYCQDQSEALSDVCLYKAWSGIINSNEASLKGDRRSLLVMSSRSDISLQFDAGPFYKLTKDTFVSVASLSFSYYLFFFGLKLRTEQ